MNFILCRHVCLLIDQRNLQCSEVCFNLPARYLELFLLFVEYRVVNNLVKILKYSCVRDLDNFYFLSYDSRVGAPEWKIGKYYTYC
jgi:hypothetical protein